MTCNLAQLRESCSPSPGLVGNARLDLLGAPADVSLSHVARGLDRGNELEGDVADTDDADSTTSNVANGVVAKEEASQKDIEDTTANERKEEVGISRNLRGDLELQKCDSKAKDNHIDTNDEVLEANGENVENASQNGDARHGQVNNAENIGEFHGCESTERSCIESWD